MVGASHPRVSCSRRKDDTILPTQLRVSSSEVSGFTGHRCLCGHELARPNQALPMSQCLRATHGIPCEGGRGIVGDPMCGRLWRLFVATIAQILPL
jgi:hypothetical protein